MKKLLMIACLALMASCDKENDNVAIEAMELAATVEKPIVDDSASKSLEKVKITNISVINESLNKGTFNIEWSAKRAVSAHFQLKGQGWRPFQHVPSSNDYGFKVKKKYILDKTFLIKVTGKNGKEAKRKIRINKIVDVGSIDIQTIHLTVSGDLRNVISRTMYIGKDSALGDVLVADYLVFPDGKIITKLEIVLDKENAPTLVEALKKEIKSSKDSYIWFKQSIK